MDGVLQVDGCMELNLSTGVCHIWMDKRPNRDTVRHEWSHCMGWAHTWDPQKSRYEWFPMPEVRKYNFAASSVAGQRGAASSKEGRDGH
jgi:hypothetical protein